jgi:alkanesulfonate monooxygenase SsuD/methylene tetrahydromethanopterin reductase-like flavin-dependent oxidoreductase (luciferase family)
VTSANPAEAQNFNREAHVEHAERYRRAWEFVDVVKGLWDSWEDGAFLRDKESGHYLDVSKLHEIGHAGTYFKVRGPLNVSRSPQGQPVLVQAGSSDDGRELASGLAEAIFTAHQTLADAQAFYDDIKARAVRHGRDPAHVHVMPGLSATVAPTESEAKEKYALLQSLIDPGICRITRSTGRCRRSPRRCSSRAGRKCCSSSRARRRCRSGSSRSTSRARAVIST